MGYRDSGAFIGTTQVWDVSELDSTKGLTPELKELLIRLYQNLNNMAMAVNGKDTGIYHTDEFVTGKLYPFDPALNSGTASTPIQRPVYRKVINFGALPNAGTASIAHGLTVNTAYTWVKIAGYATDPVALLGVPLPYASDTANDNIELSVDDTNVIVTTASNWSAYTRCWVVLEFLKF
jgi:hypothetical protein